MTEVPSLDGHRWIRLATDAEIDAEAEAMGFEIHRHGWMQDVTDNDPTHEGVWSLRGADGARVLTAEVKQEWDDWYDHETETDGIDLVGTNLDEVRAPGGRPANADKVLHVATLRAWFRAHDVKLEPAVWRDAGTVVEKWTTRSRDHADKHVKTLYVTETGERVFEVVDERIHPMIIHTTSSLTSVDGLSSGSVAMVTSLGGKPGLQMLKGDKWDEVEIREGVRIGVVGSTVEAMPGRLRIIPPRYREFDLNRNQSIRPTMVNMAVDYADGCGPGIYRPVVTGQAFHGPVTSWERTDG